MEEAWSGTASAQLRCILANSCHPEVRETTASSLINYSSADEASSGAVGRSSTSSAIPASLVPCSHDGSAGFCPSPFFRSQTPEAPAKGNRKLLRVSSPLKSALKLLRASNMFQQTNELNPALEP